MEQGIMLKIEADELCRCVARRRVKTYVIMIQIIVMRVNEIEKAIR